MYSHLCEAMRSKGLSHRAVSAAIGMPEPTFRSKINGKTGSGFTVEEAFAIQEHIFPEMNLHYLFARETAPARR